MKHARQDYQDRIVDLAGKIPEGEPVFLLRAQDPLAAEIVHEYAIRLQLRARNDADSAFAQLAHRQSDLMAAWATKKEYPDAPGVNAPEETAPELPRRDAAHPFVKEGSDPGDETESVVDSATDPDRPIGLDKL